MNTFHFEKIKSRLLHVISELIVCQEIKDYRVNSMLSIQDVELSSDGAYAKVKVSGYLEKNALMNGVRGLNSASGFIQRKLATRLHLRNTPRLTFIYDEGFSRGFEVIKHLKKLDNEYLRPDSH